MAAPLIVLAEDNAVLRNVYRELLVGNGYTVFAAPTGEEALRYLVANRPRVLILDVMLPGLSGIEVCRRARSLIGFRTPILFLTGLDDLETLRECLAAGGDDFLVKIGAVDTLVPRVDYWSGSGKRRLDEAKRRQVLKEIEEGWQPPVREEAPRRGVPADDPLLQCIVAFMQRARRAAGAGYGRTVRERLRLFGYAAGLVDQTGVYEPSVRLNFREYLKAVMVTGELLPPAETARLFAAWDEFSANPEFTRAFETAGRDLEKGNEDPAAEPVGLAED